MQADLATLDRLLDMALDLPVDARERWLEALPPEHDRIKPRLRALLARAAEVETSDFLETLPSVEVEAEAHEDDDQHGDEASGDQIGPYRLIREIGVGGMGAVWLAERNDGAYKRTVALKILRASGPREALAQRLARERDILAELVHPGIARLYDAGVNADGLPYLALEYIEGRFIDKYCADLGLDVRARVELFLQVAAAVAYAHAKLVVHRDLKPANVLVSADGQAHLLDFGISKLLEDGRASETRLTQAAGRALTPEYASPEQILGQSITIASDVYSLGVLLYELLTDARPYTLKRPSRGALEDAILEVEPRAPSDKVKSPLLKRALRGDLDAIVLKALKKQPNDRYPTVNAFAEDLWRHLRNQPVLARADSIWYRLRKFAGRNRLAVASAAAVLVSVLAGAGAATWQARVALAERDRAEEVKQFLVDIFRESDPYLAQGGQLSGATLLRTAQARIANQFADRPALRIELLTLVGSSLKSLNDLPNAEIALRQAIDESARFFGPTSLETLRARVLLADVFNGRRDTDRLVPELEVLLPQARAAYAQDPELLVRSLIYLGDAHIELGKYEAARAAGSEALAAARRSLGDSNPLTVQASNLQAESTWSLNRPAAKSDVYLPELERAVRFATAAYAHQPDHPLVLYVRDIQARALAQAGFVAESIVEHRRILERLRETLGPDSVVFGNAAMSLAGAERRLGRIAPALVHAEEGMAALEKQINHRSRDWAAAQTTYAVMLMSARRPAEAERRFRDAQQLFSEIIGPQSDEVFGVQGSRMPGLGLLRREAEIESGIALLRSSRDLGNRNWTTPYLIGAAERARGRLREALALQNEAAKMIAPGPRADWQRIRVAGELGLIQTELGAHDAAERYLREALTLGEKLGIEFHPELAEATTALGRVELARGAPLRALAHLEKSNLYWQGFDARNPLARDTALWLGRAYLALGRADEARVLLATPKTEWR